MKKPKLSLQEEIKKMGKLSGHPIERGKKKNNSAPTLKKNTPNKITLSESENLIVDTPTLEGDLQLEFWPAILRGIGAIGSLAARGGKYLPKFLKPLTRVPTAGLKGVSKKGKKLVGKGAKVRLKGGKGGDLGGLSAAHAKQVVNARALGGLKAIAILGTGTYLAQSKMSSGPGDAAASMEQWSQGGSLNEEDVLAIAFNPAVYDEAEKQGLTEEIPFDFQSEAALIPLVDTIRDATEGGEKYFGKGLVDFLTLDAIEGAGTDEEAIYQSFQAVNTLYDCSHLTGIYDLKYGSLIEELGDELSESDFQPIINILKGKPLCIINGKRIFTAEDLAKEVETLSKDLYKRPEGLPAYRLSFKELFGGESVDVFVDVQGTSPTALVFLAGSTEYLGMFEYIENSDDKVFFRSLDGDILTINNDEDKAKVMKIFNKADEGSDLMTLSTDIEVDGIIYEEGETLDEIEGPAGYADEYIDELVNDNPTTAKRQPTAIQGAAIALAMRVNDFEVLEESIVDLRKVLNESVMVSEAKYSVKYDKENDRHKITRSRGGVPEPEPKKVVDPVKVVKPKPAVVPLANTRPIGDVQSKSSVKVPEFKGTKEEVDDITQALKKQSELAVTKEGCKDLISYAAELLPKKGGKNVYQALSHCYGDFNFLGGGSGKVKGEYGLTGKGDPAPTKTQKRQARQTKRRNK